MASIGSTAIPSSIQLNNSPVTPIISNVSIGLANTEVSHALPTTCRGFTIRLRTLGTLKICYTSGQSGTTYLEIQPGCSLSEDATMVSKNLYFQTDVAPNTLEVVAYT